MVSPIFLQNIFAQWGLSPLCVSSSLNLLYQVIQTVVLVDAPLLYIFDGAVHAGLPTTLQRDATHATYQTDGLLNLVKHGNIFY